MTAEALIQLFTRLLFVSVFLLVASHAVRHPRRATVDAALFFGGFAAVLLVGWVAQAFGQQLPRVVTVVNGGIVMALPYLLLRLLEHFSGPREVIRRLAEAGLVLSITLLILVPVPIPAWMTLTLVGYFVVLAVYVSAQFIRETVNVSGITRRRLIAVSLGSVTLGAAILAAGLQSALPDAGAALVAASQAFALASGLCYAIGFVPPRPLRRAWQYPELHEFLIRISKLPALPRQIDLVTELERMTARVIGRSGGAIGLWDEGRGMMTFRHHPVFGRSTGSGTNGVARPETWGADGLDESTVSLALQELVSGQAFVEQRPVFVANVTAANIPRSEQYRRAGIRSILAAPITSGSHRMGVLVVYGEHEPIFGEDDLELIEMLAAQCAVVLETRRLLQEAASVAAREEASRIKEDFVSAAAHDLKTPLTTMMAQLQRIQRRLRRDGGTIDAGTIDTLLDETRRLNRLVNVLLDVAGLEEGRVRLSPTLVDLGQLAQQSAARFHSERHEFTVEAHEHVTGMYDGVRLQQLLDNLLENAVKYSPEGGLVMVRVWEEDGEARLAVSDQGIGVPADDLPRLFERFHRGTNVDDRRFTGLGLGLYISRMIVEEHGGRIWADSEPGQGTTIHVALPLVEAREVTWTTSSS